MVDITARISQSKVIATKVHIVDAVGLDGLTNVTLTSPADGSYIIFRSSDNQFINDNTIVKTSTGITLTGELAATSLDISGNADIDGVLETDSLTINTDQASIADTGIITSKGLIIDAGEVNIKDAADINGATTRLTVGTGDDLLLYHFNNDSYIKEVGTGSLIIQSNNVVLKNHLGSQLLSTDLDSAQLFYATNGSNPVGKLETAVNGVSIFGSLILDDGVLGSTGNTTTLVENAASDIVLTLPSTTGTIALSGANVATTQLTGTVANAQLANNTVSYGGISLALGATDATPAFNLQDATGYPTSSLVGTITNAQLAGSIANAKLANSTITVSDGSNTSPIALGGTLSFAATSNEVTVVESAGTVTIGLPDDVTIAGDLTVSTAPTSGSHVTNKTYVDAQVANVVDSAPAALNTLNELAAALGDDASFATTTATTIGEKLAKASNLSDLANVGTARTNLGLGTAATTASSAYATAAQGTTADNALQPAGTLTGAIQTTSTTNTMTGLTMNAGGSTTGASIVFREGTNNGTNAIKLQAPAQVDGSGGFGTLDITFPNAAGTMALTSDLTSFITASSSDTLTNKSIAATQLTGTIDDARIPSGIARDSELSSFITASSSDTLTNKSIVATQLTGTIDNARLPAAATSITSVGALNGGSITSGFGNINIGSSNLTAGYFTMGSSSTNAPNNVINGGLTINNFGSNDNLELVDTNSHNTTSDPRLSFYRDSSSPADNDHAGRIEFYANNDADQKTNTAGILNKILDVTDGTEDGELTFSVMQAGTANILLTLDPDGVTVDGALTVNSDLLKVVSTDAGAVEKPILSLYRNSSSIAVTDEIGAIEFSGNDANGAEHIYSRIYSEISLIGDGAEQANLRFAVSRSGSMEDPTMVLRHYGLELVAGNNLYLQGSNHLEYKGQSIVGDSSSPYDTKLNITNPTADRTILLPDAAGTIVLKDSTDTLTNKSIVATQLTGTIDNARLPAAATSITSVGTLSGLTTGATTVNGALTVISDLFEIISTAGGATEKPIMSLWRTGAASTANDELGAIRWFGQNASDEKQFYGGIYVQADDVTDGAHKGSLNFHLADGSSNGTAITDVLVDINGDEDPTMSLTSELLSVNANVLIKATASGQPQATPTPILELFQEDGPQADDGDHLGEIQFTAYNDNGFSPVKHKYAGIHAEIIDESNATEDGSLHFTCIKAGTEDNTVLTLNGTESTFSSPVKVAVGPITINSSDTNADLVITNNENSSADASPIIELYRTQSNGADGEDLGKIEFYGSNDRGLSSGGPEKTLYGSISVEIADASDGTEDGQIKFTAIKAGSATDVLTLNGSGSTLTGSLEVTGGLTASQTLANAVTDTDISVSEFATYNGKKLIYTGGAGSIHLADAVAADIGKAWTIINAGTGAITVNRATSTQTIKLLNGSAVSAGSANLTLATGGIIEIICTAADNYIAFGSGIS